MKEILELKENSENLDNASMELILGSEFKGQTLNKKDLYNLVQKEWQKITKENDLFPKKLDTLEGLDAIREICDKLSKTKSGFATSPGLYESLDEKSSGLDCVSASMVLATYLEEKGINFSYVSPVNHIALFVELGDKTYYIDSRNNRVTDLANYIKSTEDLGDFEKVNFDIKLEDKFYSFVYKYKNKPDILKAVLGNIFVLKELNGGDDSNASMSLKTHKDAAQSIGDKLENINWKKMNTYMDNYPHYPEKTKEILEEENLRLKKIGFYRS